MGRAIFFLPPSIVSINFECYLITRRDNFFLKNGENLKVLRLKEIFNITLKCSKNNFVLQIVRKCSTVIGMRAHELQHLKVETTKTINTYLVARKMNVSCIRIKRYA